MNNYKTLSDTQIAHIKQSFNSYATQANEFAGNGIKGADFLLHCIRAKELHENLLDVSDVWGSEEINYHALTNVFREYAVAHPGRAGESMQLFSTLMQAVAHILESRELILFFNGYYSQLIVQLDNYSEAGEYNLDTILPEQAA